MCICSSPEEGFSRTSKDRIYVQIPAYRDSELLVTVRDMIRTAKHPNRLRIAIAWQYGEDEKHIEHKLCEYGNIDLIKIPAQESRGCNWARSLLQNGWNREEYTLFLDSHHRFVCGWDEEVVRIFQERRSAGVAKPILTAYMPPYDPRNDPQGRASTVFRIHLRERHQGMLFRLIGHEIPLWRQLTRPVPAHFTSLHFLFAEGSFNREIAFDPSIYFFADEVAIALRAYTHGFDLFHPHRILGWHLYDRATRITHWSDQPGWIAQQEASCRTLRQLYRGRLFGKYGIGEVRSVSDYEEFIGMQLIFSRG